MTFGSPVDSDQQDLPIISESMRSSVRRFTLSDISRINKNSTNSQSPS